MAEWTALHDCWTTLPAFERTALIAYARLLTEESLPPSVHQGLILFTHACAMQLRRPGAMADYPNPYEQSMECK